jgi:hypothetical protein
LTKFPQALASIDFNKSSHTASSYSNHASGRFKDDFFITNLLGKDFLRYDDFLKRDSQFSPKFRKPWSSSYDPSPLYHSSYTSSKINEIPITQDDEESEEKVFSYDEKDLFGPQNWGAINGNCDGKQQSPIELKEPLASSEVQNTSFIIEGFTAKPNAITVYNNGHAAAMKFNFSYGAITMRGGPLETPYVLDNVHWHWGDTDLYGSEHTLNGRRYSAEAHFVTYSAAYSKLTGGEASKESLLPFNPCIPQDAE